MTAVSVRRAALALTLAFAPAALPAQTPAVAAAPAEQQPAYAPVARLVLASPIVLDATIRSAVRIKGAEAASVPAGQARFYAEADVAALIRGPGAMPSRVGYLVDVPLDPRGRAPNLKKRRVLLFARPVAGNAGQIQLVTPAAQRDWTPATDARVRDIVREVVAADAPPAIGGIGNAFYVPGALPGEGETQIFLQTADRRPIALSVLRRPGERRRWGVALSEIIDEGAGPAKPDTLLWYRLACGLPRALPERAIASLDAAAAAAAQDDYRFVLAQLGPCAVE